MPKTQAPKGQRQLVKRGKPSYHRAQRTEADGSYVRTTTSGQVQQIHRPFTFGMVGRGPKHEGVTTREITYKTKGGKTKTTGFQVGEGEAKTASGRKIHTQQRRIPHAPKAKNPATKKGTGIRMATPKATAVKRKAPPKGTSKRRKMS